MKTGLLTFHAAHHYGAQLQAYALMKAVEACGSACEVIDYVRPDTEEAKRLFRPGIAPRSLLANVHTVLHYGALHRRAARFERFVRDDMIRSPKSYASYAALAADAPAYDAYVCGSDQIWNPLIYREKTFDPAFFAGFAASGRKIAYAPSFGIAEMPAEHQPALKDWLAGFESLSVRERNGEAIIRGVCGRSALTVLDPTLLLGPAQWNRVAEAPPYATPYLLCYFISDPAGYEPYVTAMARRLGLSVVSLCGARRTVRGTARTVLDAGPREFLGLFAHAAYVMTDSFHGTVFSINYGRPFASFSLAAGGKKKVSSRLDSILGILGLRSRLVTDGATTPEAVAAWPDVDWEAVGGALEAERAKSLGYLCAALFPMGGCDTGACDLADCEPDTGGPDGGDDGAGGHGDGVHGDGVHGAGGRGDGGHGDGRWRR
mgnify:FL=1